MKSTWTSWLAAGASLALVVAALAQPVQIQPGQVIYNFDAGGNTCYPDDWTFFGYPQTDFGWDPAAEDGGGAYQAVDWTACDVYGYPQCIWAGSAIGVGIFNHPQCTPGGVPDANLDLSLGTGITIRIKNKIDQPPGGTLGARLQLQLTDSDGTNAVIPRHIVANAGVDRMPLLSDNWTTYTFYFKGLDWAWDIDDAVAGTVPGLHLGHIQSIKLIWRRMLASDVNVFEFDNITLINSAPMLWPDANSDGDVDLGDFASFQACYGGVALGQCARFDADSSGLIDFNDFMMWKDCQQGPNVTTDFYPWAY